MSTISEIVNLKKHPIIKSNKYISNCNTKLINNSILQLDDFLTDKSLNQIQKEALNLKKKAFYCSQKHTILLNKKNSKISNKDPCNREMTSDKGCVPHDLIPKKSTSKKIIPAITETPPRVNATGYPIRIKTKTKANNNKGIYSNITT